MIKELSKDGAGDGKKALKVKLLKLDNSEEMNDSEVQENLLESKEWEKNMNDIVILMEKAQEDAIGTRVETRPMKDLVDNLVAYLACKI